MFKDIKDIKEFEALGKQLQELEVYIKTVVKSKEMVNLEKTTWVLPNLAKKLVDNLVRSGNETRDGITSKREYSKLREAWIASIFLWRKILIEGRLWYLRKNEVEDSSDDIYGMPFEIIDGIPYSDKVLPIQVFRRTEQSPGSLIDSIKDKMSDDLSGVSLVLYVMRDELIEWQDIHSSVVSLKPKLKDITIIGNVGGRKFIVGEIFPNLSTSIVNLDLYQLVGPPFIEPKEVKSRDDAGISKIGEAKLTTQFKVVNIIPKE